MVIGDVLCSGHTGCIHPRNKRQIVKKLYRQIFSDYILGRTTFNIIPEYREVQRNQYEKQQRNQALAESKSYTAHVYGDPKCPRGRQLTNSVQSTCPHYIVMDVDKQREPKAIAKAKCSCHKCLSLNDTGYGSRRSTGRCKPVTTFVPVIRWKCPMAFARNGDNYYRYVVDLEEVPVGCTCERARSSWTRDAHWI